MGVILTQSACLAQLRSKMEYRINNRENILLKPSSGYMFLDGEDFQDYVKIIGRDDSMGGHTRAWPIVLNDSVLFIQYMPFTMIGDSMISVHGPCLIRDYNLSAEQGLRKKITWKYPEYTEIKHIYHDDSGRAYILHAYRDKKVELKASELIKLKLMNYDVWVYTEKQGFWLKYRQTMNRQCCTLIGVTGCTFVLLGLSDLFFFF